MNRQAAKGWLLYLPAAVIATCGVPAEAVAAAGRPKVPLDGRWEFRLDPDGAGEAGGWSEPAVPFEHRILVPGEWGSQGFGQPNEKLHHHYVGEAWFRRQVRVPEGWTGKRVFLTVGGVHRYAKTYVNGECLGEHIGYLDAFEYDVTRVAPPGATVTLAICVDSEQRWGADALTGAMDIIDAMHLPWGGITGHVALEARAPTWLVAPFVEPSVDPPTCRASASLGGRPAAGLRLRLTVLDEAGRTAGEGERDYASLQEAGDVLRVEAAAPGARLWSPDEPHLHTARLTLLRGERVLDRIVTRFGLREIRVRGPHVYLNDRRLFLRGYGDDSVYPETVAPPTSKEPYLRRLRIAKSYGFNHVRHHSHILPPAYYDACDEVGMLVSPELPIAYMHYFQRAKGEALTLYETQWAAAIRRHRNHPSILDWCMGNEFWHGLPIAPRLYEIARSLDRTRPIVDSDGVFVQDMLAGALDRPTLDLWFVMFAIHDLPLDRPDKHRFPEPAKPVISHETGNYGTFPRLDLIDSFRHNFKPQWLEPVRAKLERLGLLHEAKLWARNSERLYLLCHKLNIEDLRRNPYASGHHWWLLQDYWTGSNGLVDTYFRPKQAIRPEEVRRFVNDVVLLQDGLPATCRAGETLTVQLIVSNYSSRAIPQGVLRHGYTLVSADGKVGSEASVGAGGADELLAGQAVPQGEVRAVGTIRIPLARAADGPPRNLRLRAALELDGRLIENEWTCRVYPSPATVGGLTTPLYCGPGMAGSFASWGAMPLPRTRELPVDAVYLMRQPSPAVVAAVEEGARLVLFGPCGLLPTAPTRFKTSWWLGSAGDCNVGTVVYDNPVTQGMIAGLRDPHGQSGWCDAGWHSLIEGATTYLLDGLPESPDVLVRALDVHRFCRSKALLFQGRAGKGTVVVSGFELHLYREQRPPEAEWLLKRLVEHAAASPAPDAPFPVQALRRCAEKAGFPEGPYVLGFDRVLGEPEQGTWHSFREDNTVFYTCRQTSVGNRLEWETAPVPDEAARAGATFVWAGGLGWISEPETPGFDFVLNGNALFGFDITREHASWESDGGGAQLLFRPLRLLPHDAVGLFYLRLAPALLAVDKPLRLAVVSKGEGSKRWFAVNPYKDMPIGP